LCAELWYNDGLGGADVDHDWSHAVFGVSTDFELAENLLVTPGLYYQISMDWRDIMGLQFWCVRL
jgi:hypothetical protein